MSVVSQTEGAAEYLLQSKNPSDVALLTLAGQHTYGELQNAVLRLANYFHLAGARKGERVASLSRQFFFLGFRLPRHTPFWIGLRSSACYDL